MNFFLSTVVVNSSVVFLGALLCLSFSPFDYSFLIFIVIALFKESLSEISAKKAAFRGFLFGFGMFGTGVAWVYVSMTLNYKQRATKESHSVPIRHEYIQSIPSYWHRKKHQNYYLYAV
jgi:hypothetical protein